MTARIDMIGKKFGKLVVIANAEPRRGGQKTVRQVVCKCLCGNPKHFTRVAQYLRRGSVVSCGCLSKERSENKRSVKDSKLYGSYRGMLSRAEKRNRTGDPCRIFEGWLCFETFKDWSLRNGWKQGMELCRNKDTGDYSPENVRWDTKDSNRKEAHSKEWRVVNPEGVGYTFHSLNAFCKQHNLNPAPFYKSAESGKPTKSGWSVELISNGHRKY